jgi:dipeptidyl aminopeptidase/acylaminoacyl peptidase
MGMNWRRRELGAAVIVTAALAVMLPAGGVMHAQPAAPVSADAKATATATEKAKAKAEAKPGYILPADPVQELFRRDKNLAALDQLGPDGDHFFVPHFEELSSLKQMAQRTLRLGMLELCPEVNREWRLCTYGNDGLKIFSLKERRFVDVTLPAGAFVSDFRWSPDGARLAFLAHLPAVTQVWTADVRTGKAEAVSDAAVMATLAQRGAAGNPNSPSVDSLMLQWLPDGSLLTLLVPANRGPEPVNTAVPTGPEVRRTRDKATPTATQPFLLKSPHDQALFKYYTTAQLASVAPGRAPKVIGAPAMYTSISLSPDGKYVLRETLREPFSELVGYNQFARAQEVIDLDGKVMAEVSKTPLRESSGGGGRGGDENNDRPREIAWRPDGKGLSMIWREPRPARKADAAANTANSTAVKGDASKADASKADPANAAPAKATPAAATAAAAASASPAGADGPGEGGGPPAKDRIMLLAPPFDMTRAQTLVTVDARLGNVRYAKDGRWMFATVAKRAEGGRPARQDVTAWNLTPTQPGTVQPVMHVLKADVDTRDPLALPGEIMTASSGNGITWARVSSDNAAVFLEGDGFKADFKPRPFVDRVGIADGKTARVFEGAVDTFDKPLAALDADLTRLIVSRESKTTAPDSFLWTRAGNTFEKLTANKDPYPEITAAQRVDFDFTRRDGLKVHARISLPVGYRAGTRVPAIFWDYPNEYGNAQEYERGAIRARNHNAYSPLSFLRWSDIWLTQGYALVYTDIPIVASNDRFNDFFVSNTVDTIYAAMRKVDEMGYVDIDRIGHGGHSYGAFTTANLLAHTPFFKAGIAGDGAYNRTLTPMSFQGERRNIWEAPTTYLELSPFFYADQINTPLLMYHGAQDNNSGTFLIQSERMIQALTGLGKDAVLYIYPFESHAPRAKENLLDLWARWLGWFDFYVKQTPAAKPASGATPTSQP